MTAIIREEAEPLPATVPAPLRWVTERLLAKDPAERYESTRDLYRELRQVRNRLSQPTERAIELTGAAAVRTKRHRYLPVAVLALAVSSLLTLSLMLPAAPDLDRYNFAELAPGQTQERGPAWSQDGHSIAYAAMVNGIEQIFVRSIGAGKAVQLTHANESCWYPFWSPDGEMLYYFTPHDLWAVPAAGGASRLITRDAYAASIHPDGDTVAFARKEKVWIASVHGGSAKEFWQGPAGGFPFASSRFSPDGSTLAVNNQSEIWLLSYPSGKARKAYVGRKDSYLEGLSWFPDSRNLLTTEQGTKSSTAKLLRVDVSNGAAHAVLALPWIFDPSLSRDGKKVAWITGQYGWDVVEVALANGAVHTLVGDGGVNMWPDWAPSGRHFLFTQGDSIVDQDSSGAGFSQRLIESGTLPQWSPDGTRIVFLTAAGRPKLMVADASGANAMRLDETDSGFAGTPAWSPDGEWIAYMRSTTSGQMQLLKIRAMPRATPVVLADAQSWPFSSVQWSPAGDWIAYPAGDGIDLISPDGNAKRKLTRHRLTAYGFSRDAGQLYGVTRNTTGGPQWQLYRVDAKNGVETLIAAVDFPASAGLPAGFSLSPDGTRFLTAISRWPFQIWELRGFSQPGNRWFARLAWR